MKKVNKNKNINYWFILLALLAAPAVADTAEQEAEDEGTGHEKADIELKPIEITARSNPGTVTEDNYTVYESQSATKLKLAPKDTPQAITTLTAKQIQDQNLRDLREVVEAVPGLTANYAGPAGSGSARFFARGFKIDNYQMDGMMATAEALGGNDFVSILDPFLFDNIDVVRGSTGLTTGLGDPSGSISFSRKKPLGVNGGQFNVKYGSWQNFRQELDYSRVLSADGNLRGRVVITNAKSNSFIDRANTKAHTLYGVLQYDINPKHSVTVGGSYQYFLGDQVPHIGINRVRYQKYADPNWDPSQTPKRPFGKLIVDENIPRSFNNVTRWSYRKFKVATLFGEYQYRFTDGWSLNASANFIKGTRDGVYGVIGSETYIPERGDIDYKYANLARNNRSLLADINLHGSWLWRGLEQQLVVGVNGYRSKQTEFDNYKRIISAKNIKYINSITSLDDWKDGDLSIINYLNGDKGFPYGPTIKIPFDPSTQQTQVYGPYFAVHLRPLAKLQLIIGGRYNMFRRSWDDARHQAESAYKQTDFKKFTPYYSVTYSLTKNLNLYASYTGIFKNPTDENFINKDKDGNFNPPIVGNTKEVGIKGDFFGGDLNFGASYFHMVQNNLPVVYVSAPPGTVKNNPYIETADGYVNKGWDINLAGKITPNWRVSLGYTYLKSDFKNGPNLPTDNSTFTEDSFYAPKHLIKFFTSYSYRKFTAGLGVNWQSKVYQDPAGKDFSTWQDEDMVWQPSFYLVNIMLRYDHSPNLAVALNVNNVFDQHYYTKKDGGFAGPPRNFMVSLNYKF